MTISSATQEAEVCVGPPPTKDGLLTVAQVGYTGTDDDRDRWLAASLWLERESAGLASRCKSGGKHFFQHDPIDLRGDPPRDFLVEHELYDIVVTHNLWGIPAYSPDPTSPTACSPRHSPSAWKLRFEASRACYIFLFGSDFNAVNIQDFLSGYERLTIPFRCPLNVFVCGSCANSQTQPITYVDMSRARLNALPALLTNRALDLSYADVSGEHLKQVRAMPNLEELRLVGTPVSDVEMVHVVQGTELKILVLDETKISNASLDLLKKLNRLECLSLNHTKIDDDGIGQLRELKGLKWLSLIETRITDRALSSLQEMSNLEWLCLVNTKVTAAGVEEIRKALPECSVKCNIE